MPTPPARSLARVLTLLLIALLAGACGGGQDGERALSKREYIEQSNALQQEAASIFESLDGRVATTPAQAAQYLAALDALADGLDELQPPRDWRDSHATMLASVRTMREAMDVVSRAAPANTRVIEFQLRRSRLAQEDYERAVREINASR